MRHIPKLFPLLTLLVLTISGQAHAQACLSDAMGTNAPPFRQDINLDLKDYGQLFLDATHPDINCARRAGERLHNKVNATLNTPSHATIGGRMTGPFQGWLEGAHINLIFATAMQLAARGELNTTMDMTFKRARDYYYATLSTAYPYGLDPGCGLKLPDGSWNGGQNTCMDDHAVAASGFGWVAAYEKKRGRDATNYINATRNAINRAFSTTESICINNPNRGMTVATGGPCNGTIAELANIQADTKSLNHGFQDIPYGLGLMTSISAAVIGLEEAGYITNPATFFTSDQKTLAKGLLREGQQKAVFDGSSFKSNCLSYTPSGNNVNVTYNRPCADAEYRPKMYPLKELYRRYSLGTPDNAVIDPQDPYPATAYQWDQYDEGLFNNDFANAGRLATYLHLGYYWHYPAGTTGLPFKPRPALSGANRAEGYSDGISSTGVISGWACDQLQPARAVELHIYAGSSYVTSALTTLGSEPAVNTICKGGSVHRFQVTIPAWTKGQLIQVYAIDPTWLGHSILPFYSCADSPYCRW